ncbi:hypothetical protein [Malonomonas rubra]|uniref:hypothetical protein n=1 Tax=Malonomonas rubra TaxID=57040 RepID=UPI0026EBC8D3|nr:hypothetical protein [Malonomonas rubra]
MLRNLGELMLQMLLGPEYDRQKPFEIQCDKISDPHIHRLLGRLLLPVEQRFISFNELLEDLQGFDEIEGLPRLTTEQGK